MLASIGWGVVKDYLYSLLPDLTAFLFTIVLAEWFTLSAAGLLSLS